MKMEEIVKSIKDLAKSQGFYGRLLENLMDLQENDLEGYNRVKEELESKNFKDVVDLILYIEG